MEAPLYEQIYNYLFDRIKTGDLASGARVPSEKELADQFNVSRITSKKAMEMLSAARLIERIQGKGSFVANPLPDLSEMKPHRREEIALMPGEGAGRRMIGLILPDFADSYGSRLIHGVEEGCAKLGFSMLMKLTFDNRQVEEEAIRSFLQLGVDGLVVFPVHGKHYNLELLRLVLDKFPVIFVDRYLKGLAASSVYTDNRKAAFDLTKLLLDQGHRHIGFLSLPAEDTSTIEDRILGFMEGLSGAGQVFKPQLLMTNLYSSLPQSFDERNIKVDMERVEEFVRRNPQITAFVCAEYNLALILHEVLLTAGKRIPEDCGIVCFDSPVAPFGKPLFTHIRQNEDEMGRHAVELLRERWEGREIPFHNTIAYTMVEGRSTKPLGARI